MKRRNFLIVAVLGMLSVVATVTAMTSIPQNAYAEEKEDEDKNGHSETSSESEENEEEDKNGHSETSSEHEQEYECNISGVLNTCIIGDAPTGAVQTTTQDQSETPMILALPT